MLVINFILVYDSNLKIKNEYRNTKNKFRIILI